MKLYQWQTDCLRAWENENYQGIVNAVTGSGKTQLALAAIRLLRETHPDLRVRIIAPTIALANQWRQSVLRDAKDGKNVGSTVLSGSNRQKNYSGRYTIVLAGSAGSIIQRCQKMRAKEI